MAMNSLAPAFVRLFYHSAVGFHVMTLPTRAWITITEGHASGSYEAWDESSVDADDMIQGFADQLAACLDEDGGVDSYVIYTKEDATAPNVFRVAAPVGTAGGIEITTQTFKAVQSTHNYVDSSGHIAKLVLLDAPVANFEPVSSFPSLDTVVKNLLASWAGVSNAWASRFGDRPTTFRRATYTLNEKLRREYRLT